MGIQFYLISLSNSPLYNSTLLSSLEMGNYVCFTFATLILVTLTDFTAAKYVVPVDQLSVNQVNKQWPATIPTFVYANSSATSWLIHQNLWDILLPQLSQEQ